MPDAEPAAWDTVDWSAWHAGYEDPDSGLGRRLEQVRAQLRAALDRSPPGPIRLISVCAGQGHDVIGALADHPRRGDVGARLVELDAHNAALAGAAARASRLDAVEVLTGDASTTDAYVGAVPADLVLVCGVFGNIADADIANTIENLSQLCAPRATIIWTRHRRAPDRVGLIRETFARVGFSELAFAEAPPFGIGVNRLQREPRPFRRGVKLFDFIGYQALWPHLSERERADLGPLFRADSSLIELVEAMRALPCGLPSEPTVECMLLEARGTSATKHLFLAQVLAKRFPTTEPALIHRVYRLDRGRSLELFGAEVTDALPSEGLIDVHRYLTLTLEGARVSLDVSVPGGAWDGRTSLPPACGPGRDFPAGADPDAEMAALAAEHAAGAAREGLLSALAAANAPAR